jgi:hypothetical protein
LKKCYDIIRNRTRDISGCSIVPQPTTLPRASSKKKKKDAASLSPYTYCTYSAGPCIATSAPKVMLSVTMALRGNYFCPHTKKNRTQDTLSDSRITVNLSATTQTHQCDRKSNMALGLSILLVNLDVSPTPESVIHHRKR